MTVDFAVKVVTVTGPDPVPTKVPVPEPVDVIDAFLTSVTIAFAKSVANSFLADVLSAVLFSAFCKADAIAFAKTLGFIPTDICYPYDTVVNELKYTVAASALPPSFVPPTP